MKLSTLLLSSAALVVAGSAFAADLPAKKGAPAAKATGCPAFGAGFFSIPGGDSCIKFSGYVDYVGSVGSPAADTTETARYSQAGSYRLLTDVRSNTEVGAVRGAFRLTDGAMDRAFVQAAGLTAGQYGSVADIAGSGGWNFGSDLGEGTGIGVKYEAALGASTVTVALENSADNNSDSTNTADRPDVLLGFATSVGGASLNLVGVSHQVTEDAQTKEGYAFLGKIGVAMGSATAGIYGGVSQGAGDYTGADERGIDDSDSGTLSTGNNYGVTVTFAAGNGTLGLDYNKAEATLAGTKNGRDRYGVSYGINVAKNFSVMPELVYDAIDEAGTKSTSTTAYLRIARDF